MNPTIEKIKHFISHTKNSKALSEDNINTKLIKHDEIRIYEKMYDLIKKIWNTGNLLKECKNVLMTIHKKGGETLCHNYRESCC